MRRRISVKGCVRPSIRRSVGRSEAPSLRRLLGASYAEYSALFSICSLHDAVQAKTDIRISGCFCILIWVNSFFRTERVRDELTNGWRGAETDGRTDHLRSS